MKYKNDNGPYNIFAEEEITIEFYDLDPLQIVWHGNYFNFFEKGRRSLLQKIKYDYYEMQESGYAFPIIEISAKYFDSLKFKDNAIVKAILMEYENRLRIKYEIRNVKTEAVTTAGLSTQMAVDMKTKESCFVSPQALINKVEALLNAEKQ